jgi:leader peptidase (prepilin peptidase)/N-methyltransferase
VVWLALANLVWLALCLGWLSWVDIRTHLLPNQFVLAGLLGQSILLIALAVVSRAQNGLNRLLDAALGCLAMSLCYLVIYVASRGSFGMGDVKFSAQLGLFAGWFGWNTWLWALISPFLLAGLVTVALLMLRRLTLKDHIAFGPFMSLGALFALVATGEPWL